GGGAVQPGAVPQREPRAWNSGHREAADLTHPVQADLLVDFAAFGPVFLHLHVEEEVHRHAEHFAQLLARGFADGLDPRAPLAEHDRLLAVAADDDLLVDLYAAVLADLIAFGPHRAIVRQFFVELPVELFTGHFRREQTFAGVGDLIFGIVPRPLGHQ